MANTASPIADVHWAEGLSEHQEPLAGYFPSVRAFIKGHPTGKQIAWKAKSASTPNSSLKGQFPLNYQSLKLYHAAPAWR